MLLDLSKYYTSKNPRRLNSTLFFEHYLSLPLEEGKKLRMVVIKAVLNKEGLIVQDKDFLKKIGSVILPIDVKDIPKKHLDKYQVFGDNVVRIYDYFSVKDTRGSFNVDGPSNPNLKCIQVDDAEWSTTNWDNYPGQVFSKDCGY